MVFSFMRVASLHMSECNLAGGHHTHALALACLLGSSRDTAFNSKSWVPSQLGAVLILSHKMEIWVEFTLMGFLAYVSFWDEERPTVIAEPLPALLWLESSFCYKYSPGPQGCPWNRGRGVARSKPGDWPKEASLLFDTKWERKERYTPQGRREGNKARKNNKMFLHLRFWTKCYCIWGFAWACFPLSFTRFSQFCLERKQKETGHVSTADRPEFGVSWLLGICLHCV